MSIVLDPRLDERRRDLRERRVRRRLRKALYLVLAVAAAGSLVWLAYSPLLAVDRVEVSGAVTADVEAALRRAGFSRGTPVWRADTGRIAEEVRADPRVADVRVRLRFPDSIEILVLEREAVAWVEAGGTWLHVDVDGVVIAEATEAAAGAVVRVGSAPAVPGRPIPDAAAVAALEFVAALDPDLAAAAVVTLGDDGALWVEIGGDFRARLGGPQEMAAKAAVVAALAAQGDSGVVYDVSAPARPSAMGSATDGGDGVDDEAQVEGEGTVGDGG